MKKITIVILLLSVGLSSVNAQEKINSLVKNSPFHFIGNTFHMSYEKSFAIDKSVNISGGFHLNSENMHFPWNSEQEIGWAGELQVRKYLLNFKKSNSGLSGVYVAPYAKGAYFRTEGSDDIALMGEYSENWVGEDYAPEESYVREIKNIQVGALMGVQVLFANVVSMELFLGGGVQFAEVVGSYQYFYDGDDNWGKSYTGVMPRIGFNIGVAL